MRKVRSVILVVVVLLGLNFAAYGGESSKSGNQVRSFSLPKHGSLLLELPVSWKQSIVQPQGDLPPIISFSPDNGDDFQVLINPLWSMTKDTAFNKSDKIKIQMEQELKTILADSSKKHVALEEFQGVDGKGYYFIVSDMDVKSGIYVHVLRSEIGVGDLLLSVIASSKVENSPVFALTINGLKKAMQKYEDR